MFGFENLKQNSYEQLIINTANEELQNVFYRHVFEYDQKNHQKEGIPYPPMMHKENSKTLELLLQVNLSFWSNRYIAYDFNKLFICIQKPIGIFNIIKEECRMSNSDDIKCVEKLNEYFHHHSNYITFKQNNLNFGVSHFAGKVRYSAARFLSKNKETLLKTVLECMQKSDDHFVSDMFMALPGPNGSFSK
jgi:myosin heavy subunit